MKGAEETLRQRSGNDADQAALLVALLRASDYPARYVRGVIEFFPEDLAKVTNLTGVQDPEKMAELFRRAGIPFEKKMSGLDVVNYQVEHIWVEAEIPCSNYRGILSDAQGKIWLGLDTSIKVADYAYTDSPIDLYQDAGNPLPSFRDDYLATLQALPPLEVLKSAVQSHLDQNHPGTLYNSLLTSRQLGVESLKILPASLQFTEVAVTGEFASLPSELIHSVRFTVPGAAAEPALDVTLPAFELSNRKVILSYEPETVEDQEIINAWGGLDNTPAYLVRLRPVLKIDGERRVIGKEGFAMGAQHHLMIELTSPNGVEDIDNTLLTGYPAALGVVSQEALPPTAEQARIVADDLLYSEALNYADAWNDGEREFASLLQVALVRPVPTVTTVGGALEVTTLLGEPQGFLWKGLFVDADLRAAGPVSRVLADDDRERAFMQLSAVQGSVLEGKVFEDAFAVESISTGKLFGVAGDAGVAILTLDATNLDALLPGLPFAANVKDDITAAVSEGMTVRIPEIELAYQDWHGIGYIKENLDTGEAGYMLSGVIAGGMTAVTPDQWVYPYVYALENPFTDEINSDPTAGVFIHKIASSDLQAGTVGEALEQPLAVLVRDENLLPVEGASVTFTILDGGGEFLDASQNPPASVQSLQAVTDARGIATIAEFVLGKQTSANPVSFSRDGDTYASIAGQNTVTAALDSGAELVQPFVVYALAGEPSEMTPLTNGTWGDILTYSGGVTLKVTDQYQNPVANAPIDLQSLDPQPNFGTCDTSLYSSATQLAELTVERACSDRLPVYGECGESAAPTIQGLTRSDGSLSAWVILGGVPYAKYPIQANYTSEGETTSTLTHTFESYTKEVNGDSSQLNVCGGESPPHKNLHLLTTSTSTARKANTQATLSVKSYLQAEGKRDGTETLSCSEPLQCAQVVGDRVFTNSVPEDLAVTFNGNAGSEVADGGLGMYEYSFTLAPGHNEIAVVASTTQSVSSYSNSCNACGQSPVTSDIEFSASESIDIVGVDIQMPELTYIQLDENGFAVEDTTISYTILPADYTANFAQALIYRNGSLVAAIPSGNGGTGTFTISEGTWFDVNSLYTIQVVLDYSGENEIWGEKEPLFLMKDIVNLSIEGLPDSREDDVGSFVLLNNDFDEWRIEPIAGNLLPDNAGEAGIVQSDDEIRKAYLILSGQGIINSGQWKLVVSNSENFKVFRSDGQGGYLPVPIDTPQEVTLPKIIPLYIEGLAESSGIKSDNLKAVFTAPGMADTVDVVPLTIIDFDMAVDGDRNRIIDFLDAKDESYLFWVNNDHDEKDFSLEGEVEDDLEHGDDSADDVISSLRDLEDFARLQVKVGGNIPSNALNYTMQMVLDDESIALPQANLFQAVDGSDKYLGLNLAADDKQPTIQLEKKSLGIVGAQQLSVPADLIQVGNVSPFLFEGRTNGRGRLRFTASYDGLPVLEREVSIALWDMSYFYDHFIVEASGNFAAPVRTSVLPVGPSVDDSREGLYRPSSDEYVLFIHGWNVEPWLKRRWAETLFKRLWWQGYKGRVGLFDWPCETFSLMPGLLNFDTSEYKAWHSAPALKNLLIALNQSYPEQARILAHSQGNVTAGEAINLGPEGLVHAYVASQAAVSASLYHQQESEILPALNLFTHETPEIFGNYPEFAPAAPFWTSVSQKLNGRLFSYFNESDYALTDGGALTVAWEFNNRTKPDETGKYNYIGDISQYPNPPALGEGFVQGHFLTPEAGSDFLVERELRFPLDRYEIFSFAAESRTKALGSVRPEGDFNEFARISTDNSSGSRDLQNQFGFNDKHYSHSRQFRSNVIDEQAYWRAFMVDAELSSAY